MKVDLTVSASDHLLSTFITFSAMPWCSSLLIHLGEPTYFRDMLPFSSLCKNNFKNLILPPLKFSAVFFIHRVIQIGYLLYITIFS